MEQIKCINCDEISVISPRKRCTNCNYPLFPKEKKEPEISIDLGGSSSAKPNVPEEVNSDHTEAVNEASIVKATSGIVGYSGIAKSGNTGKIEASLAAGTGFTKHVNAVANKEGVKIKAGWLIVHTKEKATVTYDLLLGKNVVGRPTDNNDVDIPIEGDPYVSRKHMTIHVSSDSSNSLTCKLADNGFDTNPKPSTNGTFINGKADRLGSAEQYSLQNNDSVQIGETVVVFRSVYEDLNVDGAA
ncbi:MAG: FHA domain-containing protein, partial [Flavobacteriales bacterium]|nr:FHA domain-containing protein [Flavobacteriales bacterium]